MTRFELQCLANRITYKDWCFAILEVSGIMYLQIIFTEADIVTGQPSKQTSRKWMLSEHMTQGELFQTALLAVLVAEEHETREKFQINGHAIFGPHFNVDKLLALCETPDAHEVRK